MRDFPHLPLALALSVLSGHAQAHADAQAPWQVVGAQGLLQVVIVPKAFVRDSAAYKAEITRLCPPERACFINFYENTNDVKAELPLPDAIAAEVTARFRRSMKNGAELFQWSCRVDVQTSDTPCF
jgi:hypothetical protein